MMINHSNSLGCSHVTFRLQQKTTHLIYGVSVDSTGMFFSEIFISSVLGGFFGGILIWLLMKILESRQNGINVARKIPREHDERH